MSLEGVVVDLSARAAAALADEMIVLAFGADGALIETNEAARTILASVDAIATFATLFPNYPDAIAQLATGDATTVAVEGLLANTQGHCMHVQGLMGALLLDPDAMQTDAQLGTVGRICDKTEAGTGSRAAADVERERTNALRAFLLVRLADRRFAIPLSQVEEIIATRTSGLGLTDRAQGIDDYIIHRGRGVPLIDLHRVLGIADSGNGAPFTVLASADGNQAGFMVDELCAVERSSVQLLSDTGGDRAMARIAATITTRGATYPIIDLRAAIETLCPPPPPENVPNNHSLAFEKPLQTSS